MNAVRTADASTYSCKNVSGRAGQRSQNITVARGVSGILRTPPSAAWVAGASRSNASAADVALISSTRDFVQVGWYVGGINSPGSPGYLPYSAGPRLFWGERIVPSNPPSERLYAERQLSWNTYYKFTVQRTSVAGQYKVMIQANEVGRTHRSHNLGIPKFVGEVTDVCVTMRGLAARSSGPERSLQFLNPSGVWGYWDTTKYSDQPAIFKSIKAGDIATDSVFGGG